MPDIYGTNPDYPNLSPEEQYERFGINLEAPIAVSESDVLIPINIGHMNDWDGYRSAMQILKEVFNSNEDKTVHVLFNIGKDFNIPTNNIIAEAAASLKYAPYNSAKNRGKDIYVTGDPKHGMLDISLGVLKRALSFAGYKAVSSPEEAIEKIREKTQLKS